MINSTIFLNNLFTNMSLGYVVSQISIYYFLLFIIVVAAAGFYFIVVKYKRYFAHKRGAFLKKVDEVQEDNKMLINELNKLKQELPILQAKLKDYAIKADKWSDEKKKLETEIDDLKSRLESTKKNEDIVIEYYMNKKSDD